MSPTSELFIVSPLLHGDLNVPLVAGKINLISPYILHTTVTASDVVYCMSEGWRCEGRHDREHSELILLPLWLYAHLVSKNWVDGNEYQTILIVAWFLMTFIYETMNWICNTLKWPQCTSRVWQDCQKTLDNNTDHLKTAGYPTLRGSSHKLRRLKILYLEKVHY